MSDIDLINNVANKFSMKAAKKLLAQKAYAYAFRYYCQRAHYMNFHDDAFGPSLRQKIETEEERRNLIGEIWALQEEAWR